jgi:hypothetical protein
MMRAQRWRALSWQRCENGDAAADYGISFYSVLMFLMLVAGMTLGFVGFWRASMAAAAERAAYAAGTHATDAIDAGGQGAAFFALLTGKRAEQMRVSRMRSEVRVGIERTTRIKWPFIDDLVVAQNAEMGKYVERFETGAEGDNPDGQPR